MMTLKTLKRFATAINTNIKTVFKSKGKILNNTQKMAEGIKKR